MNSLIAQVRLEDVFKSTQESMNSGTGAERLLPLVLVMAAVLVLLVVVHARKRSATAPKTLHSPGKLAKEVGRAVGLKSKEMRQLRQLAEDQGASSPLVVLICPSLLAKGLQKRRPEDRQALGKVVRRISGEERA
jgi:hypothetical protein